MPAIFLSDNREDQARATLFAEAFQTQGFDVWWDVGLKTWEAYDQVTEKALREARAIVALWSNGHARLSTRSGPHRQMAPLRCKKNTDVSG